jgi:translocation and assembly module TamB
VDGLHQDGRATLSLDIGALKVGDVVYRTGTIRASIDGKTLDASAHLDQEGGWVDVTAQAATKWGAELAPSLDPARSPTGTLKAKSFEAALFLPFVDESFTELDGRLDANMKVTLDTKTGRPRTEGSLAFSKGRVELAAMGGEFHDVAGSAVFTPDGVVKVDGVTASAMSGRVEAAATARLDGLALASASAVIQIPARSPLLLTFQGAQVGTVDGKMNVTVKAGAKDTDVKVDIPTLHVELPLTSSRDIQALGEMQGVRIGVDKKDGKFLAERLDSPRVPVVAPAGKTITTTIALGSDVVVKKGTELSVALGGSPVFAVSDAVRASGQVRLLGGKIDVQGKSFDIDRGTVTFLGDATNPEMVITASWTAGEGTKVYADLRGTLKAPKVTLRSEPAYSQNEIIALLVYGSADASNPNAQGNGTAQTNAAAGVAGGAATQPLNSALANMGLGGVSTRVDTSNSTPRADVEVQIARSVSLQIAEVMGIPPPGTNPDTTLLTLSFRFAKSWAAQSTIGSAGTSIWDMIWQYRY